MTPEALAARIDHTNLSPGAAADDIARLCDEAVRYGFAAVCVNPARVAFAASRLRDRPVAVCAVAGFPSGGHDTAGKASEARMCVQNGAREIDMVANTGYLRDGSIECYHADIKAVRSAIGAETTLKVIIEAPLLEPADIVRAAVIAANAGADFVKTSTGVYASAREDDVALLRRVLPPEVKIKAAGGIRSAVRALAFLSLGAHRIGTSASVQIIEELKK
jgi:deoxyribose-phosphate aldolase